MILIKVDMRFLYRCMLAVAFLITSQLLQAQTALQKGDDKAVEWFKNRGWAPAGLTLQAHPSTDKVEFARQYAKNKTLWDKAFLFLKEHDLEKLTPGKYPIDSTEAYVSVTEGPSKEFDKTNWESHRRYIDLQYIARGKEKIGVAPVPQATVVKPYDEAKDVANYSSEGQYYIAEPGTFFLFFPQDAHRPSILVDGYNTVKKVVIKVKAAP